MTPIQKYKSNLAYMRDSMSCQGEKLLQSEALEYNAWLDSTDKHVTTSHKIIR